MYNLFRSTEYKELCSKLDNAEQQHIRNIEDELKMNPYTGKPLGFKFLREKRLLGGKRVIFLIYDEANVCFCIAITTKKNQSRVIRFIKSNLKLYREAFKKLQETAKLPWLLCLLEHLVARAKGFVVLRRSDHEVR